MRGGRDSGTPLRRRRVARPPSGVSSRNASIWAVAQLYPSRWLTPGERASGRSCEATEIEARRSAGVVLCRSFSLRSQLPQCGNLGNCPAFPISVADSGGARRRQIVRGGRDCGTPVRRRRVVSLVRPPGVIALNDAIWAIAQFASSRWLTLGAGSRARPQSKSRRRRSAVPLNCCRGGTGPTRTGSWATRARPGASRRSQLPQRGKLGSCQIVPSQCVPPESGPTMRQFGQLPSLPRLGG